MSLLKVYTIPEPVLRQKAAPIDAVTDDIRRLMRDMLETMYETGGIGLAANQVGILKRIIVLDLSESRDGSEAYLMANPEIIYASEDDFTYNEGCLSVRPIADEGAPDLYADVTRPKTVRVRYLDDKGDQKEIEASELFSSCLQHEIDHLDGVLFIDHLSALKRRMIMRKVEKKQKLKG